MRLTYSRLLALCDAAEAFCDAHKQLARAAFAAVHDAATLDEAKAAITQIVDTESLMPPRKWVLLVEMERRYAAESKSGREANAARVAKHRERRAAGMAQRYKERVADGKHRKTPSALEKALESAIFRAEVPTFTTIQEYERYMKAQEEIDAAAQKRALGKDFISDSDVPEPSQGADDVLDL
jgi:hypothetical protein